MKESSVAAVEHTVSSYNMIHRPCFDFEQTASNFKSFTSNATCEFASLYDMA